MDQYWEMAGDVDLLRRAFESCSRIFPAVELDPWEWWLDEFERTKSGIHVGPYSCLACLEGDQVVGGITWNRYALEGRAIGAIGYNWVEDSESGQRRHRGLGRENFEQARIRLATDCEGSGQHFSGFLLESNKGDPGTIDSRPFWRRLGFQALASGSYLMPCLQFDRATGHPLSEDAELELMADWTGSPPSADWLERILRIVYFDWYGPVLGEFENAEAHARASAYVEERFRIAARALRAAAS